MTNSTGAWDASGGRLGRAADTVTWFLVMGVGQALLVLPGGLASLFLARDPSNLPLFWALFLPVGPAVAAGLAALHARDAGDDRGPLAAFLKGVRLTWSDGVRIWGLGTGVVTVLGFNATFGPLVGLPPAYAVCVAALSVVLLTWTLLCLVVAARATFRFRDVLRLGGFYLVTRPLVCLGVAGVVLAAALVVATTFDAVLALSAWLLTSTLHVVTRPVITHLLSTFVGEDAARPAPRPRSE